MAEEEHVKIILVTGGVISGVGKGIVSSSLGVLLKAHGYRVTAIKIDPYINVDAGTFSPWEHGEVFVLDDGGEVDLDLGNYERFLNVCLTKDNNITTGKIMKSVIDAERAGAYLGKTVQYVPHVTDKIKEWVLEVAKRPVDNTDLRPQVCIVELGGTVGDMESLPYLYALSQFTTEEWRNRFFHVHVSMLVDLDSGELKTKPLQNGIQEIRSQALRPDLIVCRSFKEITQKTKEKISNTCVVSLSQVIGIPNLSNIYKVPLEMMKQNVLEIVEKRLELRRGDASQVLQNCPNIQQWTKLTELVDKYTEIVKIAFVGKYFALDHTVEETKVKVFKDAYASVIKALNHAATHSERKLELVFVVAEHLEEGADEEKRKTAWESLKEAQGVLVPGGFGYRGVEGKILACKYARENKIPFLGVCLGMQCAAVEFARNVCGTSKANSTEFEQDLPSPLTDEEQVVIHMPEHHGGDMGGSQRLGRRATLFLTKKSMLYKLYGEHDAIEERHRHRYEINPSLVPMLNAKGLRFVGMGVDETNPSACNHESSESSKSLLKLACKPNHGGEKDFCQKVKDLCQRGSNTNTAVRMEMLELENHPYFVGVQYHPEYTSHPLAPSPPFLGLLLAATGQLESYVDGTRMPSPIDLFKNVDPASGSNFHFLPSAGNSSASLLASLNNLEEASCNGNALLAPGPSATTPPPCDENSSPVFTSSANDKRGKQVTVPLIENVKSTTEKA